MNEKEFFDQLFRDSPTIQRMKAQSETEGQVKALRDAVVNVVETRFPSLSDLARQTTARIDTPEALMRLLTQISVAPDEARVRSLLTPTVA